MRQINSNGIELIKHYEGFSEKPYNCPAGYKTIGYGHKLNQNENLEFISKHEAEILLRKDLENMEIAVDRLINVEINENQFSALVSFTYNLGSGAFQRSTLRQKINYASPLDEISNEFTRWVYFGGQFSKGLLLRRNDEANLFLR